MTRLLSTLLSRFQTSRRRDNRGRRPQAVRLTLEWLECRLVPSAKLYLNGAQTLVANTNVQASNNVVNGTMESEMSVDVNPANPLQIAGFTHNIFNLNQIQLFFSTNGGTTWSRRVLGNSSGGDFVNDGWGNVERFDPGVKFDANGELFVSYGAGTRIVVARSKDGGSSFSNFYSCNGTGESGIDKPQIGTGPSNFGPSLPAVYVTWTRNLGDGQHIAVSGLRPDIDGGFTTQVNISGTPNNVLFSDPAVGPEGEVYVVWHNYNTGTSQGQIRMARNLNFWGGGSWSGDIVVQTLSGTMGNMVFYTGGGTASFPQPRRGVWNVPSIDVDRSGGPNNGRVYIAFGTLFSTPPGNDTDVYLRYSDDKGATWTNLTSVATTTATEFLPWLAVDQNTGSVNVAYYTTTGLPGTDCRLALSSSFNGGASFTSSVILASQPTRSNVVNYAGDMLEYIGLAVNDGTAQAFWADNRGPTVGTFKNTFDSETASASYQNSSNNLIITGTPASDTITLRTSAANSAYAEVLVDGVLQWAGLWASIGTITIYGFSGNDVINIETTPFGEPVTINTGSGNDTINIAPTSKFLDNIQGAITINGQGGTIALNEFDQNDPFSDTYTITGSTTTRSASAVITYNSVQSVVINGGTGNVLYNVESHGAGTLTINGNTGNDTFNLSPTAKFLDGIQGSLALNGDGGTNTLNEFDQNDGFSDTYSITSSTTTRTASALITYNSIQFLVINGGTANVTYNVESTSAATTINTGNGQNLVQISPIAQDLNNIVGSLAVNFGTNTNNQITMFDSNNASGPSNYTVTDTSTTVDTVPGFVLTYNFPANAGVVDVEDSTLGSAVINNTVNITALFNGLPA
jgi:hypothetical protein